MSFLTESAVRRVAMLPRAIAITAPRPFTTSIAAQKTATQSVKDGLKQVDRAVSDKLVEGIDAATATAEKVKHTTEDVAKHDVAPKAHELKGKAAGKASELEGEAKGTAHQVKGKAKGTAEEIKRSL